MENSEYIKNIEDLKRQLTVTRAVNRIAHLLSKQKGWMRR